DERAWAAACCAAATRAGLEPAASPPLDGGGGGGGGSQAAEDEAEGWGDAGGAPGGATAGGGALLSQPSVNAGDGAGAGGAAPEPASALEAAIAAATKGAPAAAGAAASPRGGVGVRGGLREVVLCRLDARGPAPLPEGAAAALLAGDAGAGEEAGRTLLLQPVPLRNRAGGGGLDGGGDGEACPGFGLASTRVAFVGRPSGAAEAALPIGTGALVRALDVTVLALASRPQPSAAAAGQTGAGVGGPLHKRPRLAPESDGQAAAAADPDSEAVPGAAAGAAAAASVASELAGLCTLTGCWRPLGAPRGVRALQDMAAMGGGGGGVAPERLPLHCAVALRALGLAAAATRCL
ncbi:hypothetical protein MNEG_13240, partial [Monoraphidium neglectum]